MARDKKVEIEKSYIDNYSIKEFVTDQLIPKYFPDIDVSLRNIGMVGLTSEFISNISEDSFNTASVLFRESIPNRAELPESIYSHASLFQLSNIFSKASTCSFLIVLEEEGIVKNMQRENLDSSMYYFYIDKNTTVYVEDMPYVLDYDIKIRCVKKKTAKNDIQYIFTASYIINDTEKNSISDIVDPYIKIRKTTNGFIALEVKMRQVTRDVQYEQIVTNSKINMPYIDINFEGQLVGFDILYKTPEESEYTTQMQKLLVYSQPLNKPFCYYQLYNDNTLRLTFNAKDSYFIPKFNSELKIILYLSKGKEANFDAYTGSNVTIEPDTSVYNYNTSIMMAAKPLTGSFGGDDKLDLTALQALTVESYRTANALTTEPDLSTYFSNYKYNYGDFAIKFIKRRNDVYERIFGGYCLMQYESEIFKTNTLDIHMNLNDMDNPDKDLYMIEPGTVFEYNTDKNYATFYRTENSIDYHDEYESDINSDNAIVYYVASKNPDTGNWVRSEDDNTPEYLRDRKISFAEYKVRKGYRDIVHVSDIAPDQVSTFSEVSNENFKFINPFLIRFKKSPNLVSLYQTYINEKVSIDFTNQNDDMFVQFVAYQVQVQRDFGIKYVNNEITKDGDKEYTITTAVMPSITLDVSNSVIAQIGKDNNNKPIYNLNNRYTVNKNDLRVLFVIYNNGTPVCYSEMYPTSYDEDGVIMYETKFRTSDHISSQNMLHLLDDSYYLIINSEMIKNDYNIDVDIQDNWYFKVDNNDTANYYLYDTNDVPVKDQDSRPVYITLSDRLDMESKQCIKYSAKVMNMTSADRIYVPTENVECKIFTLYNKIYDNDSNGLIDSEITNNIFVKYDGTPIEYEDSTYHNYIWTNEYTTGLQHITFIKPLANVRSALYFEDYTAKKDESYIHDIMDVRIESVPFIKWTYAYDSTSMASFMSTFTTHYENISNIINNKLRNETSIDVKFYNTYGRSNNYYIGDDETKLLNTLNLRVEFDMWFVAGTDTVDAVNEIKQFIKDKIETISENGTNQIHISNLMRNIEHTFSYVDHIRFNGFNDYSTQYQSIKLKHTDIDELSKEDRRKYVPELLVIDLDDIIINPFDAS